MLRLTLGLPAPQEISMNDLVEDDDEVVDADVDEESDDDKDDSEDEGE